MMVVRSVGLIIFGYLLGSIPASYLAGKWLRGIDLRRYGSGTVSGSMVYEHVAKWAIVPVGLFDIAKSALPTWLGLFSNSGEVVAALAGLSAVLGHNWPIYLRFTGGRGISPLLGIWLILFPLAFPWMLIFLAIGWLIGDSAPFHLASLILLPVFSYVVDGPAVVTPVSIAALLITLVKRLEANRRPLPKDRSGRWKVILRRLLLDRDIVPHQKWIHRFPEE